MFRKEQVKNNIIWLVLMTFIPTDSKNQIWYIQNENDPFYRDTVQTTNKTLNKRYNCHLPFLDVFRKPLQLFFYAALGASGNCVNKCTRFRYSIELCSAYLMSSSADAPAQTHRPKADGGESTRTRSSSIYRHARHAAVCCCSHKIPRTHVHRAHAGGV